MEGTARAAWLADGGRQATRSPLFRGPAFFDVSRLEDVEDGHDLLQLAWELARLAQGEDAQRTLLALALAMLLFGQRGSTTAPLTGKGRAALDALLARLEPDEARRQALQALLDGGPVPGTLAAFVGPEGSTPLLLTKTHLSLHRLARLEDRLAGELARQFSQAPLPLSSKDVAGALASVHDAQLRWNPEQQVALLNAVHQPFTVITGGPGTGKTTIVVSLLRLLVRLGVDPGAVALAAPTGKAANRMFEEVGRQLEHATDPRDVDLRKRLPEPRTLHRLLGYSPGRDRFSRDESNPLEQDVVIVDESSMVDLFLMERLFRACRPRAGTPRRLVLLGDANQLPSVEAGMVLSELAEATPALRRPWHALVKLEADEALPPLLDTSPDPRALFLTTLQKSLRMREDNPAGKAILQYASAINAGDVAKLEGPLRPREREHPDALQFSGVEHVLASTAERGAVEHFFERWWDRHFESLLAQAKVTWRFTHGQLAPAQEQQLKGLLRGVEAQRILCLTRGESPTGARRVNDWFAAHRRRAERLEGKGRELLAGEPVMFLVNDYHLKLFNGDHGVVGWTSFDGEPARLRVVFPRAKSVEAFELSAVREHLQRAYALTVHKAQGSQVECAALLLPDEGDSPLLVRQLVYTAVSRASQSVVLVGPLAQLALAAQRPVERYSAVLHKAQGAMP
jgi:exodeoxyribonuclease V alpha subunit